MNVSDHPVPRPVLTTALLDELVESHRTEGRKPHAFDTRLRYSSSGGCTRRLAYEALGVEPSNDMDEPSLWVTWLGTVIHEHVQAALVRKYGINVKLEVKSITVTCDSSGSADAVVVLDVHQDGRHDPHRVLWELKTVNGTAFKTAIGVDSKRYGWSPKGPKGPRWSARLQGAINALAHDCDILVIGYLAMESLSKGLAAKLGLDDRARFVAEWAYPREVWQPWAEREIARQADVLAFVDGGELPERFIIDDSGGKLALTPEASRRYWACDYCSHLDICMADGPGIVPVPVTLRGATA